MRCGIDVVYLLSLSFQPTAACYKSISLVNVFSPAQIAVIIIVDLRSCRPCRARQATCSLARVPHRWHVSEAASFNTWARKRCRSSARLRLNHSVDHMKAGVVDGSHTTVCVDARCWSLAHRAPDSASRLERPPGVLVILASSTAIRTGGRLFWMPQPMTINVVEDVDFAGEHHHRRRALYVDSPAGHIAHVGDAEFGILSS